MFVLDAENASVLSERPGFCWPVTRLISPERGSFLFVFAPDGCDNTKLPFILFVFHIYIYICILR